MTDSPEAASPQASAPKKPRRKSRRSHTLSFVVLFIAITFGSLAIYRSAVKSTIMSRYLFEVASNTSAILDHVGYKSSVEGDMQTKGREREIRAELAAWERGEEAPKVPPKSGPHEPPITRWEYFQHRLYQNAVKADKEQNYLDLLSKAPPPHRGSASQLMDFSRERIKMLGDTYREPIYRASDNKNDKTPVVSGHRYWGDPAALQALNAAKAEFRKLESNPPSNPQQYKQKLADVLAKLEKSRNKQIQYLKKNIERRKQLSFGTGPLIFYVHKAGVPMRIKDTQEQIENIKDATDLSAAARNEKTKDLQAKLAQLKEKEKKLPPNDPANKNESFTFRVIADCGAIQSMVIFIAAVLAFPTRFWKRIVGVLLGVPFLYVVNVLRLASLGVIGALTSEETFQFAHKVVWQGVYIVFVVVVWLLWMELLVRPRARRKKGAAP